MSLADESYKFERRIREAPEVAGLDPVAQLSRYRVASIAVLIDLILATIHPEHFDQLLLTPLEKDAELGDAKARAQLGWLRRWHDGTDAIGVSTSDAEIPGLLESGRELIDQAFLIASYSNSQTGEPRFATLYETLKRLEANQNYLAGACVVYLDIAFQDAKSALDSQDSRVVLD